MSITEIRLTITRNELMEFALRKFEERGITIAGIDRLTKMYSVVDETNVKRPGINVQPYWDFCGRGTDERMEHLEEGIPLGSIEITINPGILADGEKS